MTSFAAAGRVMLRSALRSPMRTLFSTLVTVAVLKAAAKLEPASPRETAKAAPAAKRRGGVRRVRNIGAILRVEIKESSTSGRAVRIWFLRTRGGFRQFRHSVQGFFGVM